MVVYSVQKYNNRFQFTVPCLNIIETRGNLPCLNGCSSFRHALKAFLSSDLIKKKLNGELNQRFEGFFFFFAVLLISPFVNCERLFLPFSTFLRFLTSNVVNGFFGLLNSQSSFSSLPTAIILLPFAKAFSTCSSL